MRRGRHPLGTFFTTIALLLGAGLVAVSSALYHSEGIRQGAFLETFLRQVVWVVVGCGAGLAVYRIPYTRVAPVAFPLYVAGLASLAGVLLFGANINGATRWFRLGPLSVQPSEFAKLFALLALARSLSWSDHCGTWKGFLAAWTIAAIPMVLIQMQPDLTTALLLAPAAAAMLWLSGTPWHRWAAFAAAALILGAALWSAGAVRDYQKTRVRAFLQKVGLVEHESPGAVRRAEEREAYQEIQARIAIGSGGLFGKGFLRGTQNQLSVVPMSSSDFIFAVIGEEGGFVGATVVLALLLVLAFHLFAIASRASDPFGKLFVAGFGVHFSVQAAVNIAMATGAFPVVGIPLPLVSAGGSSMVATLMGLGLAARVGMAEAPRTVG